MPTWMDTALVAVVVAGALLYVTRQIVARVRSARAVRAAGAACGCDGCGPTAPSVPEGARR